jgi:starvation-inducible DNA-binding protein
MPESVATVSRALESGPGAEDRRETADRLSRLLADTYTLYLKTQGFHWNVTGPLFASLHQMFEQQYTELALAVDVVAERIRALDVVAPGSFEQFVQLSSIHQPTTPPRAEAMIKQLVEGHEAVARTARHVLAVAEPAGDQVTMDLVTQRLQVHEKSAWVLRSLLE